MYSIRELLKNDTSLLAGFLTLLTGLLTGPLFQIDGATAGALTGMVGLALTVWVRAQVYSKRGAAQAATEAATAAVKAVGADGVGPPGEVTELGARAIQDAVQAAVPDTEAPTVTATTTVAPEDDAPEDDESPDELPVVQDDRPVNEAGESLNKDGSVSKRQPEPIAGDSAEVRGDA